MNPMIGSMIKRFTELSVTRTETRRLGAEPSGTNQARVLGFVLVSILPVALVWVSMRTLAAITLRDDTYSHIPLIPVVSFFLIYSERDRIFSQPSSGWKIGSLFLLGGVVCFVFGHLNLWMMAQQNVLSVEALGVVLAWAGAFALFFGSKALRAASFQFLFLLFMIPLPEPVLRRAILMLQEGSSTVTAFLFNIFGVPVFRQGFDFTLPGIIIRVAEECSGIRSTLALVIMSVLAGHIFLRNFWNKIFLCLLVFPLTVFKNGLRIVTLSTLAVYVNPSFLHGRLHHFGGIVFFAAGLVPLALCLLWFQKNESAKQSSTNVTAPRASWKPSE
jgi:exosortase